MGNLDREGLVRVTDGQREQIGGPAMGSRSQDMDLWGGEGFQGEAGAGDGGSLRTCSIC